ncbi:MULTISPECIES: hypothetical protein [Streptomyces]|uniref:hypothetical protein n=1 Tax=Streptomyces TaxID=1883 RepID=UPI002E100C57|nr:hypothetical protein OG224_22855 [Streptomyces goshikiensis]
MIPFDEHRRNAIWSADDRLRNLYVPEEEKVEFPALWLVEFFPPSEFWRLRKAIDRNAWDRRRVWSGIGRGNREHLERSRGHFRGGWWHLGEVHTSDAARYHPDGVTRKLPWQFSSVQLTAIQVGGGLTAVVAFFRMSPSGSVHVNSVWHAAHEPRMVMRRGRPRAEDRFWSGLGVTQEARGELHGAARAWLREFCPGWFEAKGVPQPSVDLLLLKDFDPTVATGTREFHDSLRALGVTRSEIEHWTSEDFPKMLFEPVDESLCPALTNGWTLWGNMSQAASAAGDLQFHGGADPAGLAGYVGRRISGLCVLLGVSQLIDAMSQERASLRDRARNRHGRFSGKRLTLLRDDFLTASLDLASVARDVRSLWVSEPSVREEAEVTIRDSPALEERLRQAGRSSREPQSLNVLVRREQEARLQELLEADKGYREILSAVASMGASIDTFRIGRIALLVALASLLVSAVALSLAGYSEETVFSQLWKYIK